MECVDYRDAFISCLDSHSDGTHSLPLVSKWLNSKFLKFSKKNKIVYISDGLKESKFYFWVNYLQGPPNWHNKSGGWI